MRPRLVLGVFREEGDLIRAVRAVRDAKLPIHDAYTPYPIHGLDEALGIPRSKLPWVTLCGGAVGLTIALVLQYWTHAVSWELDVGGKPFAAWPAYAPVAFELTVLIAGLSTVAALFIACRLWPNPKPRLVHPEVTHDAFVLALENKDGGFDARLAEKLLRKAGAVEIRDGGDA